MLLGNFNIFNANPGRAIGGPTDPIIFRKAATTQNYYTGEASIPAATPKDSFPYGYVPPYTYTLSPNSGGIGSSQGIAGDGDVSSASIAGGKNATADLTGSGTISNAALGLILSAVASLVSGAPSS